MKKKELPMQKVADFFKGNLSVFMSCWRNPTEREIRFGEGALHYRDFTLKEIGYNAKGKLNKWFKADDCLIYHTN